MLEFDDQSVVQTTAKIKLIGVGGAGGNTLNSMIEANLTNIEFIAANTDAQALEMSKAHHRIQLGIKSTKGLGTGANPELGKRAAQEDLDKVVAAVESADIVFLTGGMGGGTGSGALPVIAQTLKEQGILSIVVVTRPFNFEGKRRAQVADVAIEQIKQMADTLLIVPNQRLLELVDQNVSVIEAFGMINELLCQSIKGIADIITKPGHINVDFADVRAIMKDMGLAVMGTAKASGPDRAQQAALEAITSPLLENMSIEGARGVLINIAGGPNLGLHEISQAAQVIYDQVDPHANIILGSVIDQDMGVDELTVTVIATGFDEPLATEPVIGGHAAPSPSGETSCESTMGAVDQERPLMRPAADQLTQDGAKRTVGVMTQEVSEKRNQLLDMHNLDVPAFLRRPTTTQQ